MPTESEVKHAAKTLAAARRDKEGVTPDKKGSNKSFDNPPPAPTKAKKGWIIGLCAAVALAGIGVGTYFIVKSLQKPDLTKATIQYEESNGGYKVTGVGNQNKSLIKTINIPSTYNGKPVNEIKEGALGGCANLEEVTLPFIGKNADATGKEGLFGYVFGKEMSEGAGAYTWQQYMTGYDPVEDKETLEYSQAIIPSSLYKVTITGGNVIAPGAFSCCKYISEIDIKNTNATKIGNYAFYYCSSMFDFTIPDKITQIEDKAFSRDYVLQEINIPEKVTTIGREAFSNNISMGLVYLPESVINIGHKAFYNLQSALIVCSAPKKLDTWEDDWVSDGISISYGTENIVYCENALVALCNDSTSNGKYVYLIQWTGEWETVTLNIPDEMEVNGTKYPVKVIGARFFEENTHVTTVNLGKNITTIGSYAFSACDKLTTFNFAKDFDITNPSTENTTLTSIGAYAFANCTSLQGYTCDDEFMDGVVLPNNVTNIENHAFYNCAHITHIRLPGTIETIGDSAFEGCERLLYGFDYHEMKNAAGVTLDTSYEAIRVPRSIRSIGKAAFKNCFRLQDDGETSILYPMIFVEDGREGTTPEQIKALSAKLEKYSESVFENCGIYTKTGIYSRQIRINFDLGYAQDPGVSSFDDACFKNAYMYNFVVRNENLQYVGDYAFYACYPNFPNNPVKICHNVWHIGDYAFYNWTTCAGVTFEDVYDPDPEKDLSSHLKEIGKSAFRGMNNVGFDKLVIPDTVETIGESAFNGCNKIETLKLPNNPNFKTIEPYTFSGMSNLGRSGETLVIPSNVTALEKYCFQNCSSIKKIEVGCEENGEPQPTITRVSNNVFYNCTNLEEIKWDLTNCASFASSVFYSCENLTKDATATLGEAYHTINSSTYANCANLTEVSISKGITTINSSAFVKCSKLATVTIDPEGNNCTIGSYAFKDCTSLSTIDLPNRIKSIGEQAFAGCTSLGTAENGAFHLPNYAGCSISKGAFMDWTSDQTIGFYRNNLISSQRSWDISQKYEVKLYSSSIVLTRSNLEDPFKLKTGSTAISSFDVNFVCLNPTPSI